MEQRPPQPPEGLLIAEALERSGLSIRQASARARISYGRWRQITSGYQNVSPGSYARVTGPAKTVARMAEVAGVTAGQMAEAGREDVAEVMRARAALQAVDGDGGHREYDDGRPVFDDSEDQRVSDETWEATPTLPDDVRAGMAALAVGMARQRKGNGDHGQEARERRRA